MATVAAETVRHVPVVTHRPWWRGKLVQVAGIVALMYVAYRIWALEYPWPDSLVWNSLSGHLDEFQTWVLTEKGQEDTGIVFSLFEWFSASVDHLVDGLTHDVEREASDRAHRDAVRENSHVIERDALSRLQRLIQLRS